MFRDPQVVTAAWNESETIAPRPRSLELSRTESATPDLAEGPTGIERLAQVPDEGDPFEEDDFFELFGDEDSADEADDMQDPFEDEEPAEEEPAEESSDEYDLFDSPGPAESEDESLDLFDNETPIAEPQQPASQDLWDTADEITPTPETGTSELFEKMTDAEDDLLNRHEGVVSEPENDYSIDDDDWLDLDLLQPGSEELSEQQRQILQEERAANEQSCQEEIDKLRAQRLENIDLSIRIEGNAGEDFPFECSPEPGTPKQREWSQITYMWKASGLCHKPLYFEQVHLERHGHSWGPYAQPLLSGVHFFGTIPILPYKMGLKTPNECVYTLGHYRPGDCAPYMIDAVPFTWRAAGFQFGASTGLSFLVP